MVRTIGRALVVSGFMVAGMWLGGRLGGTPGIIGGQFVGILAGKCGWELAGGDYPQSEIDQEKVASIARNVGAIGIILGVMWLIEHVVIIP
jgi:hypothetical protein